MDRHDLLRWLKETDPGRMRTLLEQADRIRKEHVGNEVHFRGLIEFSNICRRTCGYCGIRAPNTTIRRYRLNRDEVLSSARLAARLEFGSIVLQSGEDPGLNIDEICDLLRQIKSETGLAITLSLGERAFDELARLKIAGADRYLLRFETSNSALYDAIHPPGPENPARSRFEILAQLEELGYEIGTGIMVGIPGSTWDDLANDIMQFRSMTIDMIGIGPFIAHPQTPLGKRFETYPPGPDQPPNTPETVLRVLALTRIACPDINMPSTTALETLSPEKGYENGLACGANVIMPNLTDMKYRALYEIYPGKAGQKRRPEDLVRRIRENLEAMGRVPGKGPGMSPRYINRFFEK